jgi:hypothetical protein
MSTTRAALLLLLLALGGCTKLQLPSDARKALIDQGGYGCGFERLSGPQEVWTRMCLTLGEGDDPSTALLQLHSPDKALVQPSLYVITLYHLGERVWKDVPAPEGDVDEGEVRKYMGEVEWEPAKKLMPGGYVVEITRAGDDSRVSTFSVMVQ